MDNAQAVEDTEVCIVDGERLKLMMKYPTIAVKVLEEMGARLGRANLVEIWDYTVWRQNCMDPPRSG